MVFFVFCFLPSDEKFAFQKLSKIRFPGPSILSQRETLEIKKLWVALCHHLCHPLLVLIILNGLGILNLNLKMHVFCQKPLFLKMGFFCTSFIHLLFSLFFRRFFPLFYLPSSLPEGGYYLDGRNQSSGGRGHCLGYYLGGVVIWGGGALLWGLLFGGSLFGVVVVWGGIVWGVLFGGGGGILPIALTPHGPQSPRPPHHPCRALSA